MNRQFVLLGLIFFRLGSVGTHPMENKFNAKLRNYLKNEIRELNMLEMLLNLPKDIENGKLKKWEKIYVWDEDEMSKERSCINLGNDGCLNGYIVGSGGNKGFLEGAGSPGK